MAELESSITNLLNIPADKINEAYSSADDSIKALIDEYRRLNKEKDKFEVADALDELNERVEKLTKSERELFIMKLQTNNATEEQIAEAQRLYNEIEKAQKEARKGKGCIPVSFQGIHQWRVCHKGGYAEVPVKDFLSSAGLL